MVCKRFNRMMMGFGIMAVFCMITACCSSNIKGWSKESYRNPDLLNGALQKGGIAIMPVIILQQPVENEDNNPPSSDGNLKDRDKEGVSVKGKSIGGDGAYRVGLNNVLFTKIQSWRPDLAFISPGAVLKLINDKGLSAEYQQFDTEFSRKGFDEAMLKRFGNALNCRYLFISQAVVTQSKSDAAFIFASYEFGRKAIHHYVKIYGHIWDTATSERVWEGSGVGYHRLSSYERLPLIEEIAEIAVDSMLEDITLKK